MKDKSEQSRGETSIPGGSALPDPAPTSLHERPPLIQVSGVSKWFSSIRALDNVDFSVRPGEVHTLAGENGSGKSTLLKVMAGVVRQDSGSVISGDSELPPGHPAAALRAGIALVTQEGSLLPDLSIAENIYLGHRQAVRNHFISWRATRRAAEEILGRLGLDLDVSRLVRTLPSDARQIVEIARAMSIDMRVLLLDEPTSSLDGDEVSRLFAVVRHVRDEGVGVVFISHRMNEMLEITDRVTVLRDGEHVAEAEMAVVDDQWLVRKMVGRDVPSSFPRKRKNPSSVSLKTVGLTDREGRVRDVSIEVRAGEVTGLAGLVGAGRTELLETIMGARPRSRGYVEVEGSRLQGGPRQAIQSGVALLADDRREKGVVPVMSLRDNMLLSGQQPGIKLRRPREENRALQPWMERLAVRGGGLSTPIAGLSGGNQQKVLFGRILMTLPKVILFDEPTRGVDIGAKAELAAVIAGLAESGSAVLMASSELPEILALCDTVLVMRAGEVVAQLPCSGLTEEQIVLEAIGVGSRSA